MIKVAIVQRRIAPFRISFFERLNGRKSFDFTVFYALKSDINGVTFKTKKFHLKSIKIGNSIIGLSFGLFWPLLSQAYDVVVLEGAISNITYLLLIPLLKARKKKLCWWSCGFEPFGTNRIKKGMRNFLYRLVCKSVDNIVVYSSKANKYYQSLKKDSSKVLTAVNVLDERIVLVIDKSIGPVYIKEIKNSYDLEGKKIILFVGKIEPQKKLSLLLVAYMLLLSSGWRNKVALLIVGDGRERARCQYFAKKHSLVDIHFLGEIRNLKEVSIFFRISDIFVLPGAGGLAIHHAMLFGLPVVVSSADGTEEDLVIDKKTGLFFRPDDSEDLANKLDILLSKGENDLKEIGERARDRALNDFPMDKMVDKFEEAILN